MENTAQQIFKNPFDEKLRAKFGTSVDVFLLLGIIFAAVACLSWLIILQMNRYEATAPFYALALIFSSISPICLILGSLRVGLYLKIMLQKKIENLIAD